MVNKKIVQEALNQTWSMDDHRENIFDMTSDSRSSATSRLIYDVFGGEILKTHFKKGWHFYNRINGKRIDFTMSLKGKSTRDIPFEDIPSNPDEIYNYFQEEDYSTQFIRFIMAFEEILGLKSSYRKMAV
jgi:hypothetical protein